jgi:putative heme iron utilization protein
MDETDSGVACRRLMRRQAHAALATSLDGRPYVSLVALAFDSDATPLLLLSDLAQHSRDIAADAGVSLLFDGGVSRHPPADPLAEPRLTVLGEAARCDDPPLVARFIGRHPSAAAYAGFGDFHSTA